MTYRIVPQLALDHSDLAQHPNPKGALRLDTEHTIMITQGVENYSLIAGKECFVCLWLNNEPPQSDSVVIVADVEGPHGFSWGAIASFLSALVYKTTDFQGPLGQDEGDKLRYDFKNEIQGVVDTPSLGFVVQGWVFPMGGEYTLNLQVRD